MLTNIATVSHRIGLVKDHGGHFSRASQSFFFSEPILKKFFLCDPLMDILDQGSPTFLKLRDTSCVPINAKDCQFDTHF